LRVCDDARESSDACRVFVKVLVELSGGLEEVPSSRGCNDIKESLTALSWIVSFDVERRRRECRSCTKLGYKKEMRGYERTRGERGGVHAW
jgi:hypothetical protein